MAQTGQAESFGSGAGSVTRSAARMQIAPLVIPALAFLLQVTGLAARTFHGDELGSVQEALELGRNANSLPYFVLLRLWLAGGDSEFWSRFVSVFFATASVAVTYAWVKRLLTARAAALTCLLLATSPFLLVYGQQVRFYTFAVFCAGIAMWTFVRVLERSSRRAILVWLGASLLATGALVLNGLLLLSQALTLFLLTPRPGRSKKIAVLAGAVGIAVVVLLIPQVRRLSFDALAVYMNAESRYAVSRGLSPANFAKIPLTLYFFGFGESVYPLNLAVFAPGVIFLSAAGALGLWYLVRYPAVLVFVVTSFVVGLVLMYLVFDPLAPPSLQGAAPRYLIYLLPFFYLVLAAGTMFRRSRWLLVPLVLVNLAGVASYWQGEWSYGDDLVNWRQVRDFVAARYSPGTPVVIDGRAGETASAYFPAEWQRVGMYGYEPDGRAARVIMVTADFHADRRQDADRVTRDLMQNYALTDALAQYPLFVSVFDRSGKPPGTAEVNANGRIDLPNEQYGLEFQDLRLPVTSSVGTSTIPLYGAVALDNSAEKHALAVSLSQPATARTLWVVSQVVGAAKPGAGEPAAKLRVRFADGTTREFEMKLGQETGTWDGTCAPGCETAFTWHKRLALLGASAYPGSWQDFTARAFAYPFTWDGEQAVTGIELEKMGDGGTFYVWGLVLR